MGTFVPLYAIQKSMMFSRSTPTAIVGTGAPPRRSATRRRPGIVARGRFRAGSVGFVGQSIRLTLGEKTVGKSTNDDVYVVRAESSASSPSSSSSMDADAVAIEKEPQASFGEECVGVGMNVECEIPETAAAREGRTSNPSTVPSGIDVSSRDESCI